ncbi:hypothetical protein OHB12_02940 [Nocardia sp. NBC_01730]|uniref:hypothetical protein n=1 Tax=Nocardia sp. NBC_01730 TaxID=2975998 RepID=UPI002E0FF4D9|nr:hypothetical protein OHB12_02940 [Nocardia sp. NBC_01730]
MHTYLAERAVPEWQVTLDALQELPRIGAEGPIGFWGIMQGTGIGVPLTAVEPRITAAVSGCLGHESVTEAAAQITVPVEFLLQCDDEHVDRRSGLALFDAFASNERTLHANAGGHFEGWSRLLGHRQRDDRSARPLHQHRAELTPAKGSRRDDCRASGRLRERRNVPRGRAGSIR